MKKIKYEHFTVECTLEEPVTTDNFWKYDIDILQYTEEGEFKDIVIIPKTVLCKYDVEALLSGNEEEAQNALSNVTRNMEYHINKLKKLCSM
jgi:hypothetical protein